MNTPVPRRGLKAWIGVLLAGAVLCASGDAPVDLGPWQQDIRFMGGKFEQLRTHSDRSAEGAKSLARIEAELARLRQCLGQMADLVSEIEALDSRLHTLKVLELDPKHGEVERLGQSFEQRLLQIAEQMMQSKRVIDRHNADRPIRAPDGSNAEACRRYDATALELNTRHAKLSAEFKRIQGEKQEEVGRAIQAYAKAQRDFAAVKTPRAELVQRVGDLAQAYAGIRKPLVEDFVGIEVKLPLTPFSQGVPGGGLPMPIPTPVGPGTNFRAIDQLRIVTSSSRSAAGRDDVDQDGPLPAQLEAMLRSGYEFDDSGGMAPARLPDVSLPQGRPVGKQGVVPLVLPTAPSERKNAPPEIQNSPKLKAIEQRQRERFKRLKEDYERRNTLMKEGTKAKPEDVAHNQKSIASNQGGAAWDQFAKEAIDRGSKDADLEFSPKPQRKVIVPSPPKDSNHD